MSKKVQMNLFCILTILFWAIAFPLSKVALQYFSTNSLGFLRVCIASVALLIINKLNGGGVPKKKDLGWFLLSGACGFGIYLFTFNRGMLTLTSASSSIVIAITPVLTAVAAHYLYGERINVIGWTTLITAFIGVAIMMLWDGVLSINPGIFWTLGAAVVFCAYNILNRNLSKMGYKATEIVTYSMISSILVLSPFSVQGIRELSNVSPYYLAVLFTMGILSSALAYFFWSKALSMTENTSDVTNYGFLTPFVATLMGSLILSEVPSLGTVIGGSVIIVSIVIFSKKGKVKS